MVKRSGLFAWTLALLACLPAAGNAPIDYAAYRIGPEPSSVMLSVRTGVDSRGFAWQTDESVESGEVRLLKGEFGAGDDARFAREGNSCRGAYSSEWKTASTATWRTRTGWSRARRTRTGSAARGIGSMVASRRGLG